MLWLIDTTRGRITASAAQGMVAVTLTTELTDVFVPDVRCGGIGQQGTGSENEKGKN